jgi:Zn-dependent M28 family amino/carboxypeptidase
MVLGAAGVLGLVTAVDHWRASSSAIEPAATAARLPVDADAERLMADVRVLASPELEGRRAGTAGGARARAFIAERLTQLTAPVHGLRSQEFPLDPDAAGDGEAQAATGVNVFGSIRGREQESRWLLLTAHYDHLGIRDGKLYPGADDNASGVATLLAAAAHFAAHPPQHSLLFVAFDAEEQGLLGAEAFVANPPVPLASVRAVINLDMLSRSEKREIYVAGTWHWPFLRPAVEAVAARNRVRVLFGHDRPLLAGGFTQDWTLQSDHGPFHEAGIPFLYFGVEDHPDYHRPGDTPEKIDASFLAGVADLVIDTLGQLDAQFPTPDLETAG